MRFSNMILGVFGLGLVGLAAQGCGGGSGGEGGETTTGTTSGTTSGTGTGTSSCTYACCLTASCKAPDHECVGLVDNAGKTTFGLRMSQLDVTAPAALASGLVAGIVSGAVTLGDTACNLAGSGTFSWIMQFDTTAGKIKTGGAKPVSDPTAGYSFVDEMLAGKQVSPIEFDAKPDASGNFSIAMGKDLIVPIFLDAGATQYVLLPLKGARLAMGTLSKSQNCIGHYNAEGLDAPNSACLPDDQNKTFVTGGKLEGLITLEDADTVEISSLQETLCVLLAGNMGVAGPNGKVCERDANNKIKFMGDACAATPGGTCGDAMKLSADFAASSVKIN